MEKSNKTFSKDSTDLLVAFFKSIALNYIDERHVCNKIIRLLLGASCAQLAKKVEVSKQTICNYEEISKRIPNIYLIFDTIKFLGFLYLIKYNVSISSS